MQILQRVATFSAVKVLCVLCENHIYLFIDLIGIPDFLM